MRRKHYRWTEELIRNELLETVRFLELDRMPTANELKEIGRNDLHVKVSRTKKYSGWAQELGLSLKSSATTYGQEHETTAKAMFEERGYKAELTSTRHPYDLFVEGCLKVDVKVANVSNANGFDAHSFNLHKIQPTCDIYFLLAKDHSGVIERVLIVPAHLLQQTQITMGKESKWNRFDGRWDYVRKMVSFFKSLGEDDGNGNSD